MMKYFRRMIQLVFAITFVWLFWRQAYSTIAQPIFFWLSWLDPLVGSAGLLRHHPPVLFLLSATILLITVFWGRLFCGWVCPVGTVLDLFGSLKKLLLIPEWRPQFRKALTVIRFIILGGVIFGIILGKGYFLTFNPLVIWPRTIHCLMTGIFPWSIVALITLGIITFPRFWCRYFCPTGSLFQLTSRLRFKRNQPAAQCVKCHKCQHSCPMENIDTEVHFGADCISCGNCRTVCPTHSITKVKTTPSTDESRRDFVIAGGAGLALTAFTLINKTFLKPVNAVANHWNRLLRPPGALTEDTFNETCTRCGQCMQVCPSKCLTPAGPEAGLLGIGTPRFAPRLGQCMFCEACGKICPTNALAPVAPEKARLGTARINHDKCLAWSKGTECLLCVETCPTMAIEINNDRKPIINYNKCVGCGACEANCPAEGSAAIVTNAGEIRRS